jgi:hypothetical protein
MDIFTATGMVPVSRASAQLLGRRAHAVGTRPFGVLMSLAGTPVGVNPGFAGSFGMSCNRSNKQTTYEHRLNRFCAERDLPGPVSTYLIDAKSGPVPSGCLQMRPCRVARR